jgi:hypothetical protein
LEKTRRSCAECPECDGSATDFGNPAAHSSGDTKASDAKAVAESFDAEHPDAESDVEQGGWRKWHHVEHRVALSRFWQSDSRSSSTGQERERFAGSYLRERNAGDSRTG